MSPADVAARPGPINAADFLGIAPGQVELVRATVPRVSFLRRLVCRLLRRPCLVTASYEFRTPPLSEGFRHVTVYRLEDAR